MLKLNNVSCKYGAVLALSNVSMEVPDGKIVTLLGANGAGKSTALKAVSGLLQPFRGSIDWNGQKIETASCKQIVQQGIVHCPEGRQIFPELTVLENLKLGRYARRDTKDVKRDFEQVLEYFPRLRDRLHQSGGTLSGGEQQMLAIGRALMGGPKLLLLDEPSLGLAPIVTKEIMKIIKTINQSGVSVLLVEQNARLALSVADYAYVLEVGHIVIEGPSETVKNNSQIQELYLGMGKKAFA
ncbi:ABC transporter ATP-binding protein [Fodinisporobacter ferrooxydans]|uniref:ABC transporter ATP-binding protein n=1 Tax=Fodinisporobacter ferrooxydans TaxID=2901836 RepID=A0ABY4CER2_9BACL|nr:ABC transporter ATP-binding protein [Alicyclobacillaceae bacterium MYW30-H2]